MNRNWLPGGTYHVAIRGNNKQVIFYDWDDMDAFIRIVTHAYDKFNFQIYAYCIMNNHYHILVRSDQTHLSKIMMNINRRYSDYYRKKYEVVGQIYEKRYYADRVKGPRAFTSISSYIHRNPIDTKIPLTLKMEDYYGSSFQYYKHRDLKKPVFLNTDIVKHNLPKNFSPSNEGYCSYCENHIKNKVTLTKEFEIY